MKANILNTIINSTIIAGLVAGQWFGIKEAENIAIGVLWIFILASMIIMFVPADKLYTDNPHNSRFLIVTFFSFIIWLVLLASGRFITGFFYFLSWLIIYTKWASRADEENAEAQ